PGRDPRPAAPAGSPAAPSGPPASPPRPASPASARPPAVRTDQASATASGARWLRCPCPGRIAAPIHDNATRYYRKHVPGHGPAGPKIGSRSLDGAGLHRVHGAADLVDRRLSLIDARTGPDPDVLVPTTRWSHRPSRRTPAMSHRP